MHLKKLVVTFALISESVIVFPFLLLLLPAQQSFTSIHSIARTYGVSSSNANSCNNNEKCVVLASVFHGRYCTPHREVPLHNTRTAARQSRMSGLGRVMVIALQFKMQIVNFHHHHHPNVQILKSHYVCATIVFV
jgi:hypothetical protein